MLKLHVLASGSKGNAAVVENAETGAGVLIDCGMCKRDFLARCDEAGFNPARIEAVVITHEHGDHTKGLGVVLRGLAKMGCAPAIYANDACVENSSELRKIADAFGVSPLKAALSAIAPNNTAEKTSRASAAKQGRQSPQAADNIPNENDVASASGYAASRFGYAVAEERVIDAAGLRVLPFATSHDAAASFGFRIESPDGDALGYITDSGIVPTAAHAALRDVRILALESNHDEAMLKNGDYPYVIKQRIASSCGHLSNPQAADELSALVRESRAMSLREPETVVAMHISQNNNDYDLPRAGLEAALAQAESPARVLCGYQGRLTSVN